MNHHPYTPEEAARIAASFPSVTPGMLKVWKSRGRIPARFYSENPEMEQPLPANDPAVKRMIEVLSHAAIAPTKFRAVPEYWWQNYHKGKMVITKTTLVNLKREVVELRNLLRKCQGMSDIVKIGDALRAEKRLHPFNVIADQRLYDRVRGRIHASAEDFAATKLKIAAVYAAINPG